MAQFFLHLRDGDDFAEDREGYEFVDIDAARNEAVAAAREMVAERLKAGRHLDGPQIEICDDGGTTVDMVPFGSVFTMSTFAS